MADREFLFNYRFAGEEWGITIHASNQAEAMEKIKAVGMARYEGEIFAKIPAVTGVGILVEACRRFLNRR